jgi:hypothetical protein
MLTRQALFPGHQMGKQFSLSPLERSARPKPADYLFRAAVAHVRAKSDRTEPVKIAKRCGVTIR